MEIEKKYTIKKLPDNLETYPCKIIEQAYLNTAPVVRIRRSDDEYYLTYKGSGLMAREEYNLPLDETSYRHLLEKADGNIISKKRYVIPIENPQFDGSYTPQSAPTLYRKAPHILSVKKYLTVIVSTRTVDKRAQRRLACTALGLDYIGRRTHKTYILTQPHFAVTHGRLRFAPPEYAGEHIAQSYSIYHFIAVKRNTSTGH